MSNNPINLAVRFSLELIALFAFGSWGWTQHAGLARYLWAVGLPIVAALAWGAFRAPSDHGKGLVGVPGAIRLLLEALFFGGAVWALAASGQTTPASIFAGVIAVHYAVSYDRVLRLLRMA